jgi:hypothetical protein
MNPHNLLTRNIVDEFFHSPMQVAAATVTILFGLIAALKACSLLWANRGDKRTMSAAEYTPARKTPLMNSGGADQEISAKIPREHAIGGSTQIARKFRRVGKVWLWASVFYVLVGWAEVFFIKRWIGVPEWETAAFACLLMLSAVPMLYAGWGLLNLRPRGRTVALILGWLLFPTPMGLYTLWVLQGDNARMAYDEVANNTRP